MFICVKSFFATRIEAMQISRPVLMQKRVEKVGVVNCKVENLPCSRELNRPVVAW